MAKFNLIKRWKEALQSRLFLFRLALGLLLLIIATLAVKETGLRVDSIPTPSVPDLLHSLLPLIDVTALATIGFVIIQLIFWAYFVLARPRDLPKVLAIYAIFLIFRSIFINLTTFGAPSLRIDDRPYFEFLFSGYYFTQDLFPSGHTAFPFLGYLLIRNKKLKYFMLLASLVMGASVLLLHVHYSIDVLGAYFIAYGSKGVYGWLGRKIKLLDPFKTPKQIEESVKLPALRKDAVPS
ncbi:MAG TPA: phosphatase PAP2 family protein [Candidatus Nanoarchaeia archaeon]|nr:phosphatase PAP2 family protein [Candidatus Nanoarchaeia archaeon]